GGTFFREPGASSPAGRILHSGLLPAGSAFTGVSKYRLMRRSLHHLLPLLACLSALALFGLSATAAQAACCCFSAKDKDIQQPAQKVFITWDARKKEECFTVQPRFEGNARNFGMVIPTPSQPKLDAMPRDFFKELAVYTILKQRKFPESQLLAPRWGG